MFVRVQQRTVAMIYKNDPATFLDHASSTSTSASVSYASSDSDWLEVKMETDDYPDPDHSPTGSSSSPALSSGPPSPCAHTSATLIILTPPAAFADYSSGSPSSSSSSSSVPWIKSRTPTCSGSRILASPPRKFRTPVSQIRRNNSPSTLPWSGSVHTVPAKGSSAAAVQERLRRLDFLSQQQQHNKQDDHAQDNKLVRPASAAPPKKLAADHQLLSLAAQVTPVKSSTSAGASCTPSPTMSAAVRSRLDSTSTLSGGPSTILLHAGSDRQTPTLLVTDSVLGNSTFGFTGNSALVALGNGSSWATRVFASPSSSSSSSSVAAASTVTIRRKRRSDRRTPTILATTSIMGESLMVTPSSDCSPTPAAATPQRQQTPSWPAGETVEESSGSASANCLRQPNSSLTASQVGSSQVVTACSSQAAAPEEDGSLQRQPHVTSSSQLDSTSSEAMDMTRLLSDDTTYLGLDALETRTRMNVIKKREHVLNAELQNIQGQFLHMLDDLGFSQDVYQNVHSPSQMAQVISSQDATSISNPSTMEPQPSQDHRNSSPQCGLSTAQHLTPRRPVTHGGRYRGGLPEPGRTMYADFIIQQLLARAQNDTSSSDASKSDSPPPPCTSGPQVVEAVAPAMRSYSLSTSIIINKGLEGQPTKDSAKCKDIPLGHADDRPQRQTACPSKMAVDENITATSQAPLSSEADSELSASTSASGSTTSSNGGSVPDLQRELVSRIQFYSDFTIDRQKKIDRAMISLESKSKESSPPSSGDQSKTSGGLTERCVEGSENSYQFLVPVLPPRAPSSRTSSSRSSNRCMRPATQARNPPHSDTSSVARSTASSMSSHRSSSHSSTSKQSDRRSTRSSSSRGSRGSRLSTHPLASSTLISDPSNSGSPRSGSLYLWSLNNSSDEDVENLQKSYLRSSEKRRQKKSQDPRRPSSIRSSQSHKSNSIQLACPSRPQTTIGADSPPDEKRGDDGVCNTTLHLTHMVSVIEDPATPKHFGGRSFENCPVSSLRSASLPRTSTRLGLVPLDSLVNSQRTSSTPELCSHSTCPDLNCCVANIGPSNLSSGLQQRTRMSSEIPDRPDILGQSNSTSGSSHKTSDCASSYSSSCSACIRTKHLMSPASFSSRMRAGFEGDNDALADEILTSSPYSYSSSGFQPPCNSYNSPAGSCAEYTTVSDSSPERQSKPFHMPAAKNTQVVKSPSGAIFKVPSSPAVTVKRRSGNSGATHNVGVRATGSPHIPVGLLKHSDPPVSRRKLFTKTVNTMPSAQVQNQLSIPSFNHAPKVIDKKGLARRIKKFTTTFRRNKSKDSSSTTSTIQTLANL